MPSLNKVQLIGHLGRDPEIRYTQNGSAVCNVSLATSESWKDKNTGERQERSEWHKLVIFGKQAETFEKYMKKGSLVYIEGSLRTSSYEKDGQTHYSTDIIVSSFQFLDSKADNHGQQEQRRQTQQASQGGYDPKGGYGKEDTDQIPF